MANDMTGLQSIEPKNGLSGRARWSVFLLMLIYMSSSIDRQIMNILAELIKRDLRMSDLELGLMTGLAFALFYTILGVPIARLAERKDRVVIIGIATAVWSIFTALCGAAGTVTQLVLYRIGVGIGEAGSLPASHSLIRDMVPKHRRGTALAILSMGAPLGALAGMAIGGFLAEAVGWRTAFIVAGAPGLALAALAVWTMPEPRSGPVDQPDPSTSSTLRVTVALLLRKKTFLLIAAGASIKAFLMFGQAPFIASFFLRVHRTEVAEMAASWGMGSVSFLGIVLGLTTGIAGAISSLFGGLLSDRLARKNEGDMFIAPAVGVFVTVPCLILAFSTSNPVLALSVLIVPALLNFIWYGPSFRALQSIVPASMSATVVAILMLIVNLIGLGLGPAAVGGLSDYFAHALNLGESEGIRWALISTSFVGIVSAACFWAPRRIYANEVGSADG